MKYERIFEEGSLWVMIAAPSVWAAHFLLAYWIGAVWCAKFADEAGAADGARLGVAGITAAALAAEGWLAWHARRRYGGDLRMDVGTEEPTETGRTRFMGRATLMLAALGVVGILYDALPALVFATCR